MSTNGTIIRNKPNIWPISSSENIKYLSAIYDTTKNSLAYFIKVSNKLKSYIAYSEIKFSRNQSMKSNALSFIIDLNNYYFKAFTYLKMNS